MSSLLQHPGVALESEADAYEYLERLRWGDDGPTDCPHCGSTKGAWFLQPKNPAGRKSKGGSSARSQRRVWKCRENRCRRQFSVLTNTVMHATKIPVRAWVDVVFALASEPQGLSAREIADRWEITPKSAWAMLERIESALGFAGSSGPSNADLPRWNEVTDDVSSVVDAHEPIESQVPNDTVHDAGVASVSGAPEAPANESVDAFEDPVWDAMNEVVNDVVAALEEPQPSAPRTDSAVADDAGGPVAEVVSGSVEVPPEVTVEPAIDDETDARDTHSPVAASAGETLASPSEPDADLVRSDVEQLLAEAFAGSSFDPLAALDSDPGANRSHAADVPATPSLPVAPEPAGRQRQDPAGTPSNGSPIGSASGLPETAERAVGGDGAAAGSPSNESPPTTESRRRKRRPRGRDRSPQPVDKSASSSTREGSENPRRRRGSRDDEKATARRKRRPAPPDERMDSLGGGWLSAPVEESSESPAARRRPAGGERRDDLLLGPEWAGSGDHEPVVDAREVAGSARTTAGSTRGSASDA